MEYGPGWFGLMGLLTFIFPIGIAIFVLVMLYQINHSLKRIANKLEER
ncbi:hypothetical protein [Fictibacillus phosphorivorans]|nr:hypothetical protein [Fictibacillus phosphorivorans]